MHDERAEEGGIDDAARVSCPYCGAAVDMTVDPSGGAHQEYIEDCEVCCRPWRVRVSVDAGGRTTVDLSTLDEA